MNLRKLGYYILFAFFILNLKSWAQEEILDLENDTTIIQTLNKKQLQGPLKSIRLRDTLEQGMRSNFLQQGRDYKSEILDYDWQDSKEAFWLPNISLQMVTDYHKIGKVRRGSKAESPNGDTPIGYVGLDLGEYTLFNWGKDYLQYLNDKERFKRGKENIEESRRQLKHEILIKYFQYWSALKIEEAKKDGLRHSSFIYRLNKARLSSGKGRKQEYYQARSEYLEGQRDYFQARNYTKIVAEELSELISDEPGTRYVLADDLLYKPLRLSLDDAVALSADNNVDIKDAKSALSQSIRDLEIIHKENLPLPKFSMNLGAYTNSFSKDTNNTEYQTYPGSSDIDIVASINATWTITGRHGFMNSRRTKRAVAQKVIYEKQLDYAKQRSGNQIYALYKTILNLQDQIKLLEAQVENARSTFDQTLDNYSDGRTTLLDWVRARNYMIESQGQLAQALFDHISSKVKLASILGVDDYPGEVLEDSIKQVEKKP